MTDLQAKYQKLAAEYSKLRAQVPVLKKAVLDEQTKEEWLRESLKEKDQAIRKFQQEIDSLSFRNQQLYIRVEVLQKELDDASKKTGKKQKKNVPPQGNAAFDDSVIGEELQNKIEENVRLHKQVHEADLVHKDIVMQLQDKLTTLETDASQHQKILSTTVSNNKSQIEKLQEEKAVLQVKLQKQETISKESRDRVDSVEEELKSVSEELGGKLVAATNTLFNKLSFNDTENVCFNALNLPTHDRKHQLQTKELVSQAVTLVKELVQALSNFYTYYEQRVKCYPVDNEQESLSDVNKKLCQYLHNNLTYLRPIDLSFKLFHESLSDDSLTTLDTSVGLKDFATSMNSFCIYANTILPYKLLSLEEECSLSACPPELISKNMELHGSVKDLVGAFTMLDAYISLVALQSSTNHSHQSSSHDKILSLLANAITGMRGSIKEVSKNFSAKVTIEHHLPTTGQKLKVTNECILSSLVSLVTCTNKISAFFSSNLDFFCAGVGFKSRGASVDVTGSSGHPAVNTFQLRAADYVKQSNKPGSDSVPYKLAIQNRKTLYSSTESRDSLAQQVVTLQDKVTKIEQEKEHWKLETQLLQMKFEKEVEKFIKKDNSNNPMAKPTCDSVDILKVNENMSEKAMGLVSTNELGQLAAVPPEMTDHALSREHLIKQHYTKRVADLTSKLQHADSQALHCYAECRALHKRLNLSQREQNSIQSELDTAQQAITLLKDELQTTTKSYEGQLSMMSEHLAGMNEKLTSQKDEIDSLKYQLNSAKGNKKPKK